ncbi:hypothetical protein SP6_9 [Salmonella phage SP6]|uniref:Uncharacterized protein n=2 Tax=Enterobacteria phage SP6 TaxID=2907955 RepID=Q7Y5R0_BPSP6|nr:hypothetical protein SP6p09 [Salmonella phage SP6]AAP48748.2 gp9 [Salmonella phage SP6]
MLDRTYLRDTIELINIQFIGELIMRNFEKLTRKPANRFGMEEGKTGAKRNKPTRDRVSKRAVWEY